MAPPLVVDKWNSGAEEAGLKSFDGIIVQIAHGMEVFNLLFGDVVPCRRESVPDKNGDCGSFTLLRFSSNHSLFASIWQIHWVTWDRTTQIDDHYSLSNSFMIKLRKMPTYLYSTSFIIFPLLLFLILMMDNKVHLTVLNTSSSLPTTNSATKFFFLPLLLLPPLLLQPPYHLTLIKWNSMKKMVSSYFFIVLWHTYRWTEILFI